MARFGWRLPWAMGVRVLALGLGLGAAGLSASCGAEDSQRTARDVDASAPLAPAASGAAADDASVRAAFVAAKQREGALDERFHLRRAEASLAADNPSFAFGSSLAARGVTVRASDGAFQLTLRTASVGCGAEQSPVPPAVEPEIASGAPNRAQYRRRVAGVGITEWYVNGPVGLEQGYTLERSPCSPGAAELQIAVELDGLRPVIPAGGSGDVVELHGEAGQRLARISDLYAADATGRALPVSFRAEDDRLIYRVDVTGASWPIEVDPVLAGLQTTLTPNVSTSNFGRSVALSGTTAVVGSLAENNSQGAAYVFTRSGNVWSLQQKLTASDGAAQDGFGFAVSVSGNTAVIGAHADDVGANTNQGSAYVFVRSGTTWSQQAKLTASDGVTNARFGAATAVSGDTALIGAPLGAGAGYVFVRSGTTWSQQQKLTAAASELGFSVALDVDTAVLGAPANGGAGTAKVFFRTGTTWALQGTLGNGAADTGWGWAVAVHGNTALVGAPGKASALEPGAVHVYVRSGATWSYQGGVGSPETDNYTFGQAVALKGDVALVGKPSCDTSCGGRGYVFTRSGTTWTLSPGVLKPPTDAVSNNFGYATALETDIALVGATGYPSSGAAFVFVPVGGACTTGSECGTGFCVDSVCCDRACSGSCEGCSVATGATTDGICQVYPLGASGSPSCGTLVCNGSSGQCTPCANDSQCAANRYCDASGNCQLQKNQGVACDLAQNADCKVAGCRACASGNCVDGYCCSGVCDQECDVCSAALGASANGTCSIAPVGTNTATCASPQACNGQSTSCPSGCASDADCAATHYCANNNTCTLRKAQGNACNASAGADCKLGGCRVCQSNNCVDGYCCNTGCTELCAACNLLGKEGTCSALADGATPGSPGCSGYLCNGTSLTCASTCAGNGDCSQPAYYCSASSCLPSGCTSDANCAADRYCAADGQCKVRKVQASACNAGAGADCLVAGCRVCDTNNCVDGYCCNGSCTDKCGACNLATKEGTCSPLSDGATPDAPGCSGYLCNGTVTACASTCAGDADCAATHYCSGGQCLVKACATDTECAASYYCASDGNCKPRKGQGAACNASAGGDCNVLGCRVCQSNNCVDGYCCNSACNEPCATCAATGQQGACTAYADNATPDAPGCSGYLCGGATSCPTSCANDTDCAATHYCSGNQCLPKACAADTDCATTHYCASTGLCASRKGNGNACNVAAGADCKVVGCRVCQSNACVDGYCCNSGCTEPCGTCAGATPGVCSPLPDATPPDAAGCGGYLCGGSAITCPSSCASDADCASSHYCAGSACVPKKGGGEACTASSQCGDPSFPFCADGVCCNTTCTGKCMACAAANKQSGAAGGTCDAAKQGTNPNNGCITASDPCGEQASCSGSAGLCSKGAYGKSCGPTSCASATTVNGKICDGNGACVDNAAAQCAPYLCKSGACSSPCAADGDCTSNYYCSSGTCVAQSDNGKGCSAANQCKSGFCVDSVCCDAPCGAQCQACAEPGSVGQCKTVSGAPRGNRTPCAGTGACVGTCDGANPTACTFPGASKSCGTASCTGDVSQPAGSCDGNGGCATPATKNCLPYGCDSSSGACKASCASDGDCAQGATCDTTSGKCAIASATCQDTFTVKLPNGQTQSCSPYKCVGGACQQQCSGPNDCATGFDCQASACVAVDGGSGGAAGAGGSPSGGMSGSATGGSGGSSSGGSSTGGSGATDGGAGKGGKSASGSEDSGGCGCRTPGHAPAQGAGRLLVLGLLGLFAARRRARSA